MTVTTTTAEEHADTKTCRANSKTERPCWRAATERDIGEAEPTLYPKHMEVRRRGEDLDAHLHALEGTRIFLKSGVVEHDSHGYLRELVLGWHDSVTQEAAAAAHKLRVTEFLDERGPDDAGPDSAFMCEYRAHLLVRSDAIQDA